VALDGPGPAGVLLFVAAVMVVEAAVVREPTYPRIAAGCAALGLVAVAVLARAI
jgi:hypothetical protein